MREIKFRAWVKEVYENGEFAWGGYMIEPNDIKSIRLRRSETVWKGLMGKGIEYFVQGAFLPGMGHYEYAKLDDIVLMQYTGCKDKNGKEGFHKDIWQYHGVLYTVEWDEINASFYLMYSSHEATVDDHLQMSSFANGEIVGNELENPELVNKR